MALAVLYSGLSAHGLPKIAQGATTPLHYKATRIIKHLIDDERLLECLFF